MRKNSTFPAIAIRAFAFFLMSSFLFKSPVHGKTAPVLKDEPGGPMPTAVSGESWLNHLHRAFDETSMGKTGRLGPGSSEILPRQSGFHFGSEDGSMTPENVTVFGADLYRMNCRACHGEDGRGAPPEINSVLNPVRATSVPAVMARMKAAGMQLSAADATKLAQQSKGMLLDRLHRGGQDMPAFPHLRPAEVDSLLAYLRELSGVSGAQREQIAVRDSRMQVGEHIVKSTCHICHNAAGPNPGPQQLYEGAIPPLRTLTLRVSRAEFIRKVTQGAPVVMGAPPQLFRGRMPVFYYLSEEEAADVYLYLTRYPPYEWATVDPGANLPSAPSLPDQNPSNPPQQVSGAMLDSNAGVEQGQAVKTDAEVRLETFPLLAALIPIVLLGLGFALSWYELMRLSRASKSCDSVGSRRSVENAVQTGNDREQASDSALVA